MKTHVLRVESGPEEFASLFAAMRQAGLRVGWLELEALVTPSDSLGAAAAEGALRAVAIGERLSVSVKPRRGAAVLKDVLREHFTGCALVLATADRWRLGSEEPPRLVGVTGEVESWEVVLPAGTTRRCSTDELVAALRRPHPWER